MFILIGKGGQKGFGLDDREAANRDVDGRARRIRPGVGLIVIAIAPFLKCGLGMVGRVSLGMGMGFIKSVYKIVRCHTE